MPSAWTRRLKRRDRKARRESCARFEGAFDRGVPGFQAYVAFAELQIHLGIDELDSAGLDRLRREQLQQSFAGPKDAAPNPPHVDNQNVRRQLR